MFGITFKPISFNLILWKFLILYSSDRRQIETQKLM